MSQSIKKNTAYNMVKTVASIAFPLITFPYASRVLLADGIGKVNFGSSVVSYFALIASLGIATHAVRECSLSKNDRDKLSSTASEIFSINLCTTLLSYALLGITLVSFKGLEGYREIILLQSSVILMNALGCDWLNMAMEDFKFITIRTVGFQVLSLILLFSFVHEPDDYMAYAAISVLASAGANAVNIWYRRRYCKVRFTRWMRWRYHIAPILVLFAMMLAQTVFNNVDMTMLGLMHGDREVGIYSTAYKISNLISQLVFSVAWVILPRLTVLFESGDFSEVNALLRKVLGFNAVLGLPLAVGAFMVADDAIAAFAGADFAAAAPVLRVLMLSFVVNLFGGSFLGNAIMLPSKNERHFMVACVIAAVANVALNATLIPAHGAVGAAVATVASSAAIALYLLLRVDRRIKVDRVGRLLATPLAGCAAIACACLACMAVPVMWARLLASVGSSLVAYLLVLKAGGNEFIGDIVAIAKGKLAG